MASIKNTVGPGFMPSKQMDKLTRLLNAIPKRTPAEEKAISDRNAKRRDKNKKALKSEAQKSKVQRVKALKTKGSGSRNTTKFARTGGSGGAAGAGLGRGSISPKKF